jgi:hypothetical protein
MPTTLDKEEILPGTTGRIHFFWAEREDGAEVFCGRHSDGSSTDVLAEEELETVEELIHSLTLLNVG